MKDVRLLAITGILLFTMLGGATHAQIWRKAIGPTYPGISFNKVFFLNATTGWAVGSTGLVMKTTNAGTEWTRFATDTLNTNYSVHFLDVNTGFVGGGKRTYYKTTNAGTAWVATVVSSIPDTAATIRAIYFADAQRGWILSTLSSTNGRILHTTDGGTTWTLDLTVAANNMIDMSFSKPNVGVATGKSVGTLYYTSNGSTWTLAPTPSLGGFTYTRSDVRAVHMVDSVTAYATGWGSSAAGLQPSIQLKTTDAGATWTYLTQAEANRTYDNLFGIWFKDRNNGIAVGGAIRGSVVVRTTDGGANWTQLSFPCGAQLNTVHGSGNNVWIGGSDGVLYYSSNFGDAWQLLTPVPSASIYVMQFVGTSTGYAAGFDGIFMKTTDKGVTWKSSFIVANKLSPNINGMYFAADNIGYAAHSYRMVSKTTDGGTTWSMVLPDTSAATVSSGAVYFVDQNLGFVTGQMSSTVSAIHKTTNGGGSWTTTTGTVAKSLRAVAFASATVGAVVGDGLTGAFTTNGGSTWTASTFAGVPGGSATANLRGVTFLDATTALACGDKVILKSTNAGATWNYVTTPANILLYGVGKQNASIAYAVGNGEVWKTTDAGATWSNIIETSVTGILYSVAVNQNNHVWIGGASSAIYTTSPLTAVNSGPIVPDQFALKQNYPNPFNPNTNISFVLPRGSKVTMKVYSVIGEEVATIIDGENLTAGEHTYSFGALNISSGVYYYRLEAGNFVQTRKMVLVR